MKNKTFEEVMKIALLLMFIALPVTFGSVLLLGFGMVAGWLEMVFTLFVYAGCVMQLSGMALAVYAYSRK